MYNRQPKVQYNSLEDNDDVASAVPEFNPSIRGAPSKKEKKIDLVTDKSLNASKRHLAYIADFWDVLSFGICISMGNIFIAWGSGFSSGFWDFFFATALSGSCFICLFLSLAEIISIVPFGGGTYALARVTVGPYVGFLVGCCESVGNIVYAFVAMMPLGTTITYMFNGDPMYEPIYWLVIYLLVIGTEFAGRKVYFTFLRCVAFISLAIIGLYVIVSIQDIKIDQYIPNIASNTYRGGIKELLPLFYLAGWWYFGIEIMPLMNDEMKNPRVTAPRAMVSATAIVTCLAFVCILLSYAQYPSYQDDYALLLQTLPLNSGFSNAFGINDQLATILSYPGLYISNALFIYGYGKQLSALAKSKLLPSCLSWSLTASNTPYFALLFGSLVGYVVLVVLTKGYGYNYDSELTNELFNAAMMGTYFTFEVMFISYIIFKYKYAKLTRSYTSPLGVYGAIYGAMGFGFLFQSAVLFSEDDYHAFYFFVVFLVLSSIYYFLHAKHSQIFSEEEQSVMFVVYLLKANERKLKVRRIVRKHVQGRNRVAVASETISSETANTDSNVHTSPIPPPAISLVTKHSRGKLTAQTTMTNSNRYLEDDEKTNSDCYQESSVPVDSSSLPAAILEEPEYLPDWISKKGAKKKSVKFVLTN